MSKKTRLKDVGYNTIVGTKIHPQYQGCSMPPRLRCVIAYASPVPYRTSQKVYDKAQHSKQRKPLNPPTWSIDIKNPQVIRRGNNNNNPDEFLLPRKRGREIHFGDMAPQPLHLPHIRVSDFDDWDLNDGVKGLKAFGDSIPGYHYGASMFKPPDYPPTKRQDALHPALFVPPR